MIKRIIYIFLFFSITIPFLLIVINYKGLRTFIYEDFYYPTTLPNIQMEVKSPASNKLNINNKNWLHKTNSYIKLALNKNKFTGFEQDLVWVDSLNDFIVNHPPDLWTGLTFNRHLKHAKQYNLWLDIKNLDKWNKNEILKKLEAYNRLYNFKQRIIVESTSFQDLELFTKSGYFTSYYIDNFNCYASSKDSIITKAALIAYHLSKTNVCALSSDFPNVIFLEKYFKQYPILTWYLPEKKGRAEQLRAIHLRNKDQIFVLLQK